MGGLWLIGWWLVVDWVVVGGWWLVVGNGYTVPVALLTVNRATS